VNILGKSNNAHSDVKNTDNHSEKHNEVRGLHNQTPEAAQRKFKFK